MYLCMVPYVPYVHMSLRTRKYVSLIHTKIYLCWSENKYDFLSIIRGRTNKVKSTSYTANQLKTVLPNLISEDQTGFVAGRYIGDNLCLLYDMIYYLKKQDVPGLLVLIDFEKAFQFS